MKRKEIINSLVKEGFTEKTLCNFTDKQLLKLSERVIGEAVIKQVKVYSMKNPKDAEEINTIVNDPKKVADMSKQGHIQVTTEEKPSAGLSKEKKSEIVKKAKKGGDIGKKGKGFEKIVKKAKEGGAKDPEAVAAAAMWKNIKREGKEIKEWVKSLAEENFHSFTSKNEIMELIQVKLNENKPAPSEPKPGAPVREKPTTKPSKPKRENPFEPKHTPKPKAIKEEDNDKVPDFLKFDKLGIKFKNSN